MVGNKISKMDKKFFQGGERLCLHSESEKKKIIRNQTIHVSPFWKSLRHLKNIYFLRSIKVGTLDWARPFPATGHGPWQS